jgi:hypothetical protein
VGSVAGLTYYGIEKHDNVRTETTDSSAAVEATYTSGDWIDDGGVGDEPQDVHRQECVPVGFSRSPSAC